MVILIKKIKLNQKLFHVHCCSEGSQELENWSFTLIDQAQDTDSLRKKELYCLNALNVQ